MTKMTIISRAILLCTLSLSLTVTTQATTHYAPATRSCVLDLRAGATGNNPLLRRLRKILPFGRSGAEVSYTESLEETIQTLHRQLATLREESRVLRSRLTKTQTRVRSDHASTTSSQRTHDQELVSLRASLADLQGKIAVLEETQRRLVEALEAERQKVLDERRAALERQAEVVTATERKARTEMEAMRNALLATSTRQLEELARTVDARSEREAARQQAASDKLLQAERLRGEAAVAAEKEKMRRLVQALAAKEHKAASSERTRTDRLNRTIRQQQQQSGSGSSSGKRKQQAAVVKPSVGGSRGGKTAAVGGRSGRNA